MIAFPEWLASASSTSLRSRALILNSDAPCLEGKQGGKNLTTAGDYFTIENVCLKL